MMAETEEVSKEVPKVVGIESKYGSDTISNQDPPNPECNGANHHDQANDFDNSYIFVSGADDLPDDAKDVAADGSNILPETRALAVDEELDAESAKISYLPNEEVNRNVGHSNEDPPIVNDGKGVQISVADSLEELNRKTECSAESEVKQVGNPDGNVESCTETKVETVGDRNEVIGGAEDGEQEKFDELMKLDSTPVLVENQELQIGGLDLVAGSGESRKSDNISSHINSSSNANGEYGDQINLSAYETSEACQGSQDVVVGVVECEFRDVSVEAAESDVKLAREVVETHEAFPSTSLDVDLELDPINSKEETYVVEDVVECDLPDVSVKAEDEVRLLEVVETTEHEIPLSTSSALDVALNPINSKKETDVAEDIVECDLQDVSVKAEDETKLSGGDEGGEEEKFDEFMKLDSTPVLVENQEFQIGGSDLVAGSGESGKSDNISSHTSSSSNANGDYGDQIILSAYETSEACQGSQDVVVGVVECELRDVSVEAAGSEVKLAREVVETHEAFPSTFLDVDLESDTVNSKEEAYVVEDVVECGLQDVSVKAEDEVKLLEVVETTEHEIPLSTSSALDLSLDPINRKEDVSVKAEDISECDLQDVSVKAEDETKLSGEVVESAEYEARPSTAFDLDLESNPKNTKEQTDVIEYVVERELQDVSVEADNEVKLGSEVVETAEHEILLSASSDLVSESIPLNTKEETYVVENVFQGELQDVSVKAEDEIKLSVEVVEIAEHKISPATSLDLDLESTPINIKEEIDVVEDVVECELQYQSMKGKDEVKLSGEVVETVEHELPPSSSLDLDMESNRINTMEETDIGVDVVECELQDQSMKGKDEVKLSGEVVETIEHELPPSASLDLDMESNPINTKEETDVGVDVVDYELKDVHVKVKDEVKLSGEVAETGKHEVPPSTSLDLDMESHPINIKEEKDMVVEIVECESQDVSVKAKDELKILEEVIKTAEHEVPLSTSLDLDLESDPINTKKGVGVIANVVECRSQDASVKAEDEVELSESDVIEMAEHEIPSSISHGTLEPEVHVHDYSAISSGTYSGDVIFTSRTKVSDSSNVNREGSDSIELEIEDVEDMADQIDGARGSSNKNLLLRENEDNGKFQDNNTAPPGGSNANMVDGEEASSKTKIKPFNFLIKVPRFDDGSLREQIRLAKLNIDEKTKLRDAIQVHIQEKRASTQTHGIDYEYAKGEGRNARKLVRSKRMEIDSLHSVINKAKNALSIGDIDSQIYNMEYMIQHETLPLKEEKQIIREIKQLKQLREQLSYNMGSQDEIKQALEQREEAEERLKILRKELDNLKDSVLKAEAAAVEAEKKYDDENKKVKELQAQFRAADYVRQAAYVQWQSLRKELSKKSQHFFKYKDDAAIASNLVFSRDMEALYRLCTNNVENFMELWNTNDEFREDYIKFNARSTVWRLGTLDGRALGPDEEPPVLPSYVDARVNRIVSAPVKVDLALQFPTLELKQERTTESVTSGGKLIKIVTEEKNQRVTNKEPAISAQASGSDAVSGLDIINEVHEETKKSREEIEAIKKAEEKEKEEAEAKLKEQRRLEALAKAHEARERKKRQAEKLQMRAELKTLKEAEQKEKEREKRLRKKERKKAAATDVSDINNCDIAPSSESSVEASKDVEVRDVSSVAPKKPKKHWLFGKQGKTKSIPPPLRNRNKRKLQQWMWVGLTSAAILVLFWLGNIGVFSNVNFRRRSAVI